jgi:hypothetical protein
LLILLALATFQLGSLALKDRVEMASKRPANMPRPSKASRATRTRQDEEALGPCREGEFALMRAPMISFPCE